MAQVNAGRARFVSRGEYNNSTQYYLFDLVDYNGSSYFAKGNTQGNIPTNTTYWQLVAEKGNTGGDGPVGPTGNGIASIVKTASAGLIDTYTITFTNGSTTTFNVTNGQDGDVTQEYVDEENERLKSVFNVLPKVSDSGESVTLDNTGDTMLYKMDLKGNTSQEVVQGEVGLEIENTSIYVDDVNEDKENYITLKGNTYQETTSISGGDQYDSPSPDYPQDIEVVTGNNTIKVEGKNLANGIPYQANSVIQTNGTISSNNNNDVFKTIVKPNTTYTLSITSTETTDNRDTRIVSFKADGTYIEATVSYKQIKPNITTTQTFTTPNEANYILYHIPHNSKELQIEQSSTPTTYEAYQGATYEVNLGSIELCKIGTYQDRIYKNNGNWYKHSEIGKVVLTGDSTESWSNPDTYQGIHQYQIYNSSVLYINDNTIRALSNYFLGTHYNNSWTRDNTVTIGGSIIRFMTSEIATLDDFKTWLSTHNTTVYYVLATATEKQITDTTLVNQLNALYNATIYSTTHINTETSNLLPYIDLKYNVVTASPSPERASEVKVVTGNNTITISNEDGTKTQTFNLTLGNLELCKIGDYQDYFYKDNGNWYIHKEIGKVVLNGNSKSVSYNNVYNNIYQFNHLVDSALTNYSPNTIYVFANFLKGVIWTNNWTIDNSITLQSNGNLRLNTSKFDNANDFNLWLTTHNLIAYYVLTTPTTTEITNSTLIAQLDELKKAMSYYDKTLITQTNAKKPFILDVVGIRDLQDIFNL